MVIKDGAKMSKSKGNVVDPDDLIRRYGADTARLFSLFAAPPEKDLDWNDRGVEGASRFLNRVWRFVHAHLAELNGAVAGRGAAEGEPSGSAVAGRGAAEGEPSGSAVAGRGAAEGEPSGSAVAGRGAAEGEPSGSAVAGRGAAEGEPSGSAARAFRRTIHETIRKVTHDIEHDFHFNTAISAVMELVNALHDFERASLDTMPRAERAALLREAVEMTLLLLGPVSPHITEELWAALGHRESLFTQAWPRPDETALARDEVEIVVQVDGRVRGRLTAGVDAREAEIRERALADGKVRPWLDGRQVAKVVVVPGRLVNIVTRG
jgi:leucyl-tRNA synthetase